MRIPRQDSPTPWLNRRAQHRMLALVGMLCLVMVAIQFAARPSSWYWLLPPDPAAASTDNSTSPGSLDELDFQVKHEPGGPLPPGVFRSVSDEAADEVADNAGHEIDAAPPGGELPPTPTQEPEETATRMQVEEPTIPPDVLSGIEDNTVGVRRAEVEAYHQMLATVRELPDEVRHRYARDDVAFTVIMLQPDDYRGRLVGISGQLHRLEEFPVMENDAGIDRLYEGWMFTEESGNNPWRFVATSLPPQVDLGSLSLPRRVRVEGFFFKRMGYASQGGQHVAPTLLAGSFELLPLPINHVPQMQSRMRNGMLAVIVLAIVCLGGAFWWFRVSDRRYAGSRTHELAVSRLDADSHALERLADLDLPDPSRPFADRTDSEA